VDEMYGIPQLQYTFAWHCRLKTDLNKTSHIKYASMMTVDSASEKELVPHSVTEWPGGPQLYSTHVQVVHSSAA